ncbi:Protein TPR3 [Camellia lanceoleosa]|uniref:Protein TPR3 n=1 Tax=Camellia lanceoleosa TaxID=1840588 RepID=A0ACC0GYN1_9ERIC|nr:Protein TPR3 [Camellia lanceoleosa]
MANAIEREITTLQLKEKKLVTEIKRTAKTGNEQMSPAKQTKKETEELANQVLDEIGVDVASLLSVSPKRRIVGKMIEDANRMKRKRKTFKGPCIIDEGLRVQASPSLPYTIDGPSSPYVSRLKRKRKTFKAPCTIDEALRVRASPLLPRTMDGPSSSSLLVNKTLYEKTIASGFGSVHFFLDASEQQQYKEAILAYAILIKAETGQILCLIAMEKPISLTPEHIRDEKVKRKRRKKACSSSSKVIMENEERPHVLAVDDSLVDRKLIEKLLTNSAFKGPSCINGDLSSTSERCYFLKNIVQIFTYNPAGELRQHLEIDAYVGGVNDIAFAHSNKQLCIVRYGDDKTIKV